jgi:hypothetical protein
MKISKVIIHAADTPANMDVGAQRYAAGTLKSEGFNMIHAQYFSQEEFREWADDMSPRLLTMLDVLRFRFGRPIAISARDYAYGS